MNKSFKTNKMKQWLCGVYSRLPTATIERNTQIYSVGMTKKNMSSMLSSGGKNLNPRLPNQNYVEGKKNQDCNLIL